MMLREQSHEREKYVCCHTKCGVHMVFKFQEGMRGIFIIIKSYLTTFDSIFLRQRLLETCKAIADFAIFSRFGWHRRGDPLKSKKDIFSQDAILGWESLLYLGSVQYFEFFLGFYSLNIPFSLIILSQIWQQAEVSCAISGLYNLCFKYFLLI